MASAICRSIEYMTPQTVQIAENPRLRNFTDVYLAASSPGPKRCATKPVSQVYFYQKYII